METTIAHNELMSERDRKFNEAVNHERGRLLAFIRRWVPEPGDAEDIVQDVFYELLESYRLPRQVEQVGAWLYRVARNRIIDRFRKLRREEPLVEAQLDDEAQLEDGVQQGFVAQMNPDAETGPETEYDGEVVMEALLDAIGELPPEQREIFIAHELEGRSFRELAEESGVAVNTLLSRKHYAVQTLRRRLQYLYDEFNTK